MISLDKPKHKTSLSWVDTEVCGVHYDQYGGTLLALATDKRHIVLCNVGRESVVKVVNVGKIVKMFISAPGRRLAGDFT